MLEFQRNEKKLQVIKNLQTLFFYLTPDFFNYFSVIGSCGAICDKYFWSIFMNVFVTIFFLKTDVRKEKYEGR